MDILPPSSCGPGADSNGGPEVDPRLKPTPDYGTLGPCSDIGNMAAGPQRPPAGKPVNPAGPVLAIAIGMALAGIFAAIGSAHRTLPNVGKPLSSRGPQPASAKDSRQLDRMIPQKQAETLLELAVGHSGGAVEQISSRVDHWQGKVQWNPQIANLTTAALNSNDLRVRESGVEVELAAYGLGKNSASFDYLVNDTNSPNHQQKIWALWALGLMGNRGVQTDRVIEILTSHLKDSDLDSRHWAVESLALTGSDKAIEILLQAMHDDPSPLVRERAACGVAASGLFTEQQRLSAVPQLLSYTEDAALDAQTHNWAFQALGDITHQHLPNDSAAWRNWYESTQRN